MAARQEIVTGRTHGRLLVLFVLLFVEAATGRQLESELRRLESELRRRIFAPLRLRATSLVTVPRIAGPHAHGYFVGPLEDVTVGSPLRLRLGLNADKRRRTE